MVFLLIQCFAQIIYNLYLKLYKAFLFLKRNENQNRQGYTKTLYICFIKSTKMSEQTLTVRQEKFCVEYINHNGHKTNAYIAAGYSQGKKSKKSVNEAASRLFAKSNVKARIQELQNGIKEKGIYTIENALQIDQEMVARYLKHVAVLENPTSSENQLLAAKRTLQFIGVAGFNAANERINKILGFYEKDDKKPQIIYTVAVTKEEVKEISEQLNNDV